MRIPFHIPLVRRAEPDDGLNFFRGLINCALLYLYAGLMLAGLWLMFH